MTPQDTPKAPFDRAALLTEIRGTFLDRLAATVRAAGLSSPNGQDALRASAGQLFDGMTATNSRTSFELANSLTASQIRLVDDNQLELSIRLGDLSRRLAEECSVGLYRLHQRFITLLDRPTFRIADNPVSPESICRSLAEMFGAIGDFRQQSVSGLAEIENRLVQELPLLYADLNELLVVHHVVAAKAQAQQSEARSGTRRGDGAAGGLDAMAALQQAVLSRMQPTGIQAIPGVAGGVAIPYTGSGAPGMPFAGPRFDQIMGELDQWQNQGQSDLFGGSATGLPDSTLGTLRSGELMSRLRAQDAVALDVLAALFEAVFDDLRLSTSVKAAMARLQIPVLKAAILGATFFTDAQHPARALLEDMGQATMGLGPTADGTHPVCAELLRVAAGVQSEFERDIEVFARYGAELETFMARRNHELQGSAQGFIALAKKQETLDMAEQSAWRSVRSRTLATAPPMIADFMATNWMKVLVADALAGGEGGEAWRADEAVLDDLLWSVQPKAEHDDRTRLGHMVPSLLGKLKAGLDRIGVTPEARAPFLDACLVLQAAALRGKTPETPAATVPAALAGGDIVTALEVDGLMLKSVRTAQPDSRTNGDLVHELVIGDWVEFPLPDGTACCGRLCWISPGLGNPLFMNSSWDYAISVARSILERQLASEQAATGSTLSFFDIAVEKALHQNIGAAV